MESVWKADEQTAGEIVARVEPIRNRSHRTVRTLLARLVDKGAVKVWVEGHRHLYSAAVARDACVRLAVRSFSERFFGGNVQSLLLHFVENESLSEAEVQELKQRIEQIQTDQKNPTKTTTDRRTKKSARGGKRRP